MFCANNQRKTKITHTPLHEEFCVLTGSLRTERKKKGRKGRIRESEVEPPGSLKRPGLAQMSSIPFLEASSAEFSL